MPTTILSRIVTPARDTSLQLRYHILWLLLIRVVLFTLLIGITLYLNGIGHEVILPPQLFILLYIIVLYGFSIGSAAVLQTRKTRLKRFGVIQLFVDTLCSALLVYGTGCSQSIFTPLFIFPVIAGGLILYRIGGLIPAGAATLLYGLILILEMLGKTPGYFRYSTYDPSISPLASANLFAIHGLTFFLIALLSSLLAGRLRSTEERLSLTTLEYDRLAMLYKQIFEDISTGIITTDHQDRITSFNRAAERITGFTMTTVLGRPLAVLFPEIVLSSQEGRNVCSLKRGDGSSIRAGYSISGLRMPEPGAKGLHDTPNCKVITLQDISKIEAMERQVREAEKMAAIGELSASIAHDFRNPLAAISGSAQLLALEQEGALDSATLSTITSIILRESNRMAKTITDFLQFARPAQLKSEWFDLARMVAEVVSRIDSSYQDQIRVSVAAQIDAWGDRQQLQVVLTHLLENACAFSSDREGEILIRGEERENEGVGIEVLDQGPGLMEQRQERLFQPFFSTRENGTGLGLSIAKQIIDSHGGSIELCNGPSGGCLVRLWLPNPTETMGESAAQNTVRQQCSADSDY